MKDVFLNHYNDIETFSRKINSIISNDLKISVPKLKIIYITEKPKTKGIFDIKKNALSIYINISNVNIFDIAHTIIHENVHLLLTHFLLSKSKILNKKLNNRTLNISAGYKNILILDKLFYDKSWTNQPYYYNLDSSELIAEKIAHEYMYKVFYELKDVNIRNINLKQQFINYLKENVFFVNGDIYMKEIYISENIKRNSDFKMKILTMICSIKQKTNLFKIENYDIEEYKELYSEAMQEYIKHKELLEKGDE